MLWPEHDEVYRVWSIECNRDDAAFLVYHGIVNFWCSQLYADDVFVGFCRRNVGESSRGRQRHSLTQGSPKIRDRAPLIPNCIQDITVHHARISWKKRRVSETTQELRFAHDIESNAVL